MPLTEVWMLNKSRFYCVVMEAGVGSAIVSIRVGDDQNRAGSSNKREE